MVEFLFFKKNTSNTYVCIKNKNIQFSEKLNVSLKRRTRCKIFENKRKRVVVQCYDTIRSGFNVKRQLWYKCDLRENLTSLTHKIKNIKIKHNYNNYVGSRYVRVFTRIWFSAGNKYVFRIVNHRNYCLSHRVVKTRGK